MLFRDVLKTSSLIVLTLLNFSAPLAFAGGMSGGGGDTLKTSEIDVEFQASGAASQLTSLLKSDFMDARADGMRKRILSALDVNTIASGKDYYFAHGPCKDRYSQAHMGGAVIGDVSHPFCLSLPYLTIMPDEVSLFKQLIALMAHEVAHQAGYEETDAVYFQKAVYAQYAFKSMRETSFYRYQSALDSIDNAIRNMNTSGTDAQLCFYLGELNRATVSDRGLDFDGLDPEQSSIVKRLLVESTAFANAGANGRLLGPCMTSASVDRTALAQLLQDVRGYVSVILSILGPAPRVEIR